MCPKPFPSVLLLDVVALDRQRGTTVIASLYHTPITCVSPTSQAGHVWPSYGAGCLRPQPSRPSPSFRAVSTRGGPSLPARLRLSRPRRHICTEPFAHGVVRPCLRARRPQPLPRAVCTRGGPSLPARPHRVDTALNVALFRAVSIRGGPSLPAACIGYNTAFDAAAVLNVAAARSR